MLSSGKPHRDIEVLFPIAEEVYTKGTRVFDFSKIRSKEAYVLDLSGPVGSAAVQAPSLISFVLTIHGKAAHAGFEPEKGIHAVTAAALAIARLPQGHVEEDTTLNIGLIRGGTATNIVPESCIVEGEIRSYSHEKALSYMEAVRRVFREEAEKSGGSLEDEVSINLVAYHTGEEEASVKKFRRAAKKLGLSGELTETFGGSDCNTFAEHGIRGIVLSCGMYQPHSTREYTTVEDLEKGAALVEELILGE